MPEVYHALRVDDWPAADRDGWHRACVSSARLRRGGAAAGMKPVSQTSHARAYGYLLDFCRRTDQLDTAATAAAQVTPALIGELLVELQARVGAVTRWSYLQKILRVADILAPDRDFHWLGEIVADLRYEAQPRPKHRRIVTSNRLLALGLELIARGESSEGLTGLRRARLFRDGLMIAILSVSPIRLKNLAGLRLGHQVRKINDSWWIILKGSETKSARPDERPLPPVLTQRIETWIGRWRLLFLSPGDTFWALDQGRLPRLHLRWHNHYGGHETRTRRCGQPASLPRLCRLHHSRHCGQGNGHRLGLAPAHRPSRDREALQQRRIIRSGEEVSGHRHPEALWGRRANLRPPALHCVESVSSNLPTSGPSA